MAMMDTMSDKISDGPGNRVSGPLKCQIDRKPCGNTPRDQREKDCSTGIRDTHLTVPIGDSIVAASTSTPNVNAGQTIRPTDNSTKHLPSRSVQSSKKRPVDGRSTDPDSMPCGIRDRLGKVPSEQHLSNTDQHPNCPDGGDPLAQDTEPQSGQETCCSRPSVERLTIRDATPPAGGSGTD